MVRLTDAQAAVSEAERIALGNITLTFCRRCASMLR
jgi:hypothetical protein